MTQQSNAEITKFSNFINGQFVPPTNGKFLNSFNPSTDEIWAHVPDSDERDAAAAVDAAKAAFPAYATHYYFISVLNNFAHVVMFTRILDGINMQTGGALLQCACAPLS